MDSIAKAMVNDDYVIGVKLLFDVLLIVVDVMFDNRCVIVVSISKKRTKRIQDISILMILKQ